MKADTLDLIRLFANQVRYEVPLFQRPYVWRQEEHWAPMWEDIRVVTNAALAVDVGGDDLSSVPPHFLGAIVLDQSLNPTGTIESRDVIDGQQRLTTLQLVLSAAQEVAAENRLERPVASLGRLLFNPEDLLDEEPEHRYKVWPTLRDQPAFMTVMDSHGELPPKAEYGEHRLAHAETFFRKAIADWVGEAGEDAEAIEQRMRVMTSVLTRMVKVVVIDLEPNDNAQVIFETLNARGTRLLASDLVKNLIFQRARRSDANLPHLYEQYWKAFDTDHWREDIRQGRLTRPRVEVFLFHWLTMHTEREIAASALFQAFRALLDEGGQGVEDVLVEFAQDGAVFEGFDRQPYGSQPHRFFERLEALDTTTLLPVVLWLFRQPADVLRDSARLRALQILESWLVRRAVCRLTTRGYNRFFLDLLRPVKQHPEEADQCLLERLQSETADSQYWPDDEQFTNALVTQPLYGSLTQRRVRMVLLAVEDQLRTEASLGEQIPSGTTFHIEHVLPQTWQENWPLPEGATDEAVAERDVAKHRLGNLTLVTSRLNPSMSNSGWQDKKAALDDHSLLMLNRGILRGDPPAWNEESITSRGRELGRRALLLWPGPRNEVWAT